MQARRWITTAERGGLTILFVWLAWLPLPFGSIVSRARVPLIAVPFFLCAAAAFLRLEAARERLNDARPARAWFIWAGGGLLFVVLCLVQLVPLPAALHQAISPESHLIWTASTRLASMAGVPVAGSHPLTIDPRATAYELFRVAAMLAAFCTAAMLVRSHSRRVWLAVVLCLAALFEAMYGLREAALQRYEIWGWVNRLIFNRVTGTFVNPNHFAHYMAVVLPMALFLAATVWRMGGDEEVRFTRRVVHVIERQLLRASFAISVTIACIASVLLAQSRGALLAIAAGLLGVAALLPGGRRRRIGLLSLAVLVLVGALVVFLGPERTVKRFLPSQVERETFVGRRIGLIAAARIWMRFPVSGSGAGTFERVVSMEQGAGNDNIFHHAHNDYAEIAATTGAVGFVIALGTLIWGYVALVRITFGAASTELTWRRRAFQAAALASISMAMVHALMDFNFFIPSNPATLAVIAGAAVAGTAHDRRTRR